MFEPLLDQADVIVSDSLNHASIIDGIRLCKAQLSRFATGDLADLERNIDDALVMVDDCHATGFIGPNGRGTPALHGVEGRVDIVTSTLGKPLGGGMGGFVAARAEIVDLPRQRARPYLFSNSLAPPLVAGASAAIQLARNGGELRAKLSANAHHFRKAMTGAGFELLGSDHPIIPLMLGNAVLAQEFAARLLDHDVYVTAFSYPVVPRETARIRTQMSAALSIAQLDRAIAAFVTVGRELGVVK